MLLEYKGVKVYFTYRDDDIDQGPSDFMYVLNPEHGPEDAFDVRELPTWKQPEHPPYVTGPDDTAENHAAWEKYFHDRVEEEAAIAALKDAIDQGLIKPAESG